MALPDRLVKGNTSPVDILPAGPEHVAEIARLAAVVWRAHYPGIISHEQIDYMLAKMYDLDGLRREMANGIIYLRAVEQLLSVGKTSLILVPEIGLTPQLTERFSERFPRQTAITAGANWRIFSKAMALRRRKRSKSTSIPSI